MKYIVALDFSPQSKKAFELALKMVFNDFLLMNFDIDLFKGETTTG